MNLSLFIARRIIGKNQYRFSKPVIRIAITAIALSLTVMLLSVSIIKGFQQEIRNKVIGFSSHIQVSDVNSDYSYESKLLNHSDSLKKVLLHTNGIKHVQGFATKAGIIKTSQDIQGVILKGVSYDFDSSFLKTILVEGLIPTYNLNQKSNDILISKKLANSLKLKLNDQLQMYFIQQPVRVRKFKIVGIFDSGEAEFDQRLVIGDIQHIQKLNQWTSKDVGGLEVQLHTFNNLESVSQTLYYQMGIDVLIKTVIDNNPQLFDWLELQDLNVKVILFLMIIVGAINMITALFILILEQTSLIGTLKALGSTNWMIRKIFLYHSAYLIIKGMFIGNVIGLSLAFLQKKYQFSILNWTPPPIICHLFQSI